MRGDRTREGWTQDPDLERKLNIKEVEIDVSSNATYKYPTRQKLFTYLKHTKKIDLSVNFDSIG